MSSSVQQCAAVQLPTVTLPLFAVTSMALVGWAAREWTVPQPCTNTSRTRRTNTISYWEQIQFLTGNKYNFSLLKIQLKFRYKPPTDLSMVEPVRHLAGDHVPEVDLGVLAPRDDELVAVVKT